MQKRSVKKIIKEQYGDKCMLTFLKEGLMTLHHLQKRANGGKNTVENGGLLVYTIHQWLHNDIELHDKELYDLINECLILYKMCVDQNETELLEQYENEVVKEFVKTMGVFQRR